MMSKRSIAQVLVGIDGNTVLFGARKIKTKLITEIHKHDLSDQVQVIETGSIGPANQGVIIGIYPVGEMYGNLSLIHISEPTRLGMISYAVFCLKKKKKK